MPTSIAAQVQTYLKANPDSDNKELYIAFPNVRKNTLRHYRSKFGTDEGEIKPSKKTVESATIKRGHPKKGVGELENRVVKLEKQMEQVLATLDEEVGKKGWQTNPIDRRFKEMEGTLMKFLKSRSQSMPADLARLEELQRSLTHKITGFFNRFKGK